MDEKTGSAGAHRRAELERRSQVPFEDYPNYPRLPLPALETPKDAAAADGLGLKNTRFVRWVISATCIMSGLNRFQRRLVDQLDERLQVKPVRNLYAPVVAAVQALVDGPMSDPFVRAGSLLSAVWGVHADIRAGRFAPDAIGENPQESRAYLNLFGVNITFDGEGVRIYKTSKTSRLLVLAKRRMFVVDLDWEGERPPPSLVSRALREVWLASQRGDCGATEETVGLVSCARTVVQIETLRGLVGDAENRKNFDIVKDIFCTVCLDLDESPRSYIEAAAAALHGDLANRWFHSSLQFVVFGNGRACQICNPVVGLTGNVMMRAAGEFHSRSLEDPAPIAGSADDDGGIVVRELRWNLEGVPFDAIREDVSRARASRDATFDIPEIGRTMLEQHGLRPVEFFVTALHAAAFQLTGALCPVRQFVATTRYRYGAFTTADVSTPETATFQQALARGAQDVGELRRLYEEATRSQRAACRMARGRVKLSTQFRWYQEDLSGLRGLYVAGVLRLAAAFSKKARRGRADIVVSHPMIVPSVPVVGRPGSRVPYLNRFGLHYQILDDRVRVTIMPSFSWSIANTRVVEVLRACMLNLLEVLVDEPRTTPSE